MLSWALQDAGIDHAVTGAAAAARLAPFVTAVPVTEVWLSELTDLADAARAANADPVTEGHNVIFRSAKDDAPLMFRERHDGGLASRHLPDLSISVEILVVVGNGPTDSGRRSSGFEALVVEGLTRFTTRGASPSGSGRACGSAGAC
jgi:hypothetical protein